MKEKKDSLPKIDMKALDAITRKVLAYKPPPKGKKAKKD